MDTHGNGQEEVYATFLAQMGFFYRANGAINEAASRISQLTGYKGSIDLPFSFCIKSGGALRAISRKSARIVRNQFSQVEPFVYDSETLSKLRWILVHKQPHMDEYFSSLFLRACLPDEKQDMTYGEVVLTSRNDDARAKAFWPHAAVLGIGGVVNGGAKALLLFDEHVGVGKKESGSLALLIKRILLGKQNLPRTFYHLLNEVHYIDQYGGNHAKSLSTYAKYLNSMRIIRSDDSMHGRCLDITWRTAIIDACLVALLLGLNDVEDDFTQEEKWRPCLRISLADYANRTQLRSDVQFAEVFGKLSSYLTEVFVRSKKKGRIVLCVRNEEGDLVPKTTKAGKTTDLIMLMPYLPYLCYKYWGGVLGQQMLLPLWECRVYRELSFVKAYAALCTEVGEKPIVVHGKHTSVGEISIIQCETVGDAEPWIIEHFAGVDIDAPSAVNRYLKMQYSGNGYTIFHSGDKSTVILTRGEAITNREWNAVSDKLIETEGKSDVSAEGVSCGCWHVTENANGRADFLLNGNPSHQYMPQSRISAIMFKNLVENVREELAQH